MIQNKPHSNSQSNQHGDDVVSEYAQTVIERHGADRSATMAILGDIQARFHYLPAAALKTVAEKTGTPLVDVYGAATFYRSFSLKPKGRHCVYVCLGTACHVRGGHRVADEFERQLGIAAGETTSDEEFTFETVNCLGACALGPIAVIDGSYYTHVTTTKVKSILSEVREGRKSQDIAADQRYFPLEVACPHCGHSLMDCEHPEHGHPTICVNASSNGNTGWIRLCGLHGVHSVQSEHDISPDVAVEVFCPHCGNGLGCPNICPGCEGPMAQMMIMGGSRLSVCLDMECDGRVLDLDCPSKSTGGACG